MLFYDLPRYSEDINYDLLQGTSPEKLIHTIKGLCIKNGGEITDDAVKHFTILVELRFKGPDRNFHVKIEISTREKTLKTAIQPLRGVPVLTLEPSFLMTEKLLTFLDRQAGRDIFDAWFILKWSHQGTKSQRKPITFRNFVSSCLCGEKTRKATKSPRH